MRRLMLCNYLNRTTMKINEKYIRTDRCYGCRYYGEKQGSSSEKQISLLIYVTPY